MKKLLFAAFICLVAVSCNRFKSVETKIERTPDLVTYTAPETHLVGIKVANVENTLTEPRFAQVFEKNGFLVAQVGFDSATVPVQWELLNMNGKSVTGQTYDKIIYTDQYFILEKAGKRYFSNDGLKTILGPNDEYYLCKDKVFFQKNGMWGIDQLKPEWEKILILEQADGKYFRYFVKVPKKEQWKVYGADGKFIKNSSTYRLKLIERDTERQKLSGQKWGNENLYGRTVKNIKAY